MKIAVKHGITKVSIFWGVLGVHYFVFKKHHITCWFAIYFIIYVGSNKNIECNNDPSPENEKDDKSIKETSPKKRQRRHSLTVCETPSRKKSDSDSISSSNFDDPETSQNSTFAQRKMLATQMSKMSMSATSIASASSVSNSRCSTPVEVHSYTRMKNVCQFYNMDNTNY